MPLILITAITSITAALVFYTLGVFWGRKAGILEWKHFAFFAIGLVCDITGTVLMSVMAGGWELSVHGLAGILAISMMTVKTVMALFILRRKDAEAGIKFRKSSIYVWLIWLVPYLGGAITKIAK